MRLRETVRNERCDTHLNDVRCSSVNCLRWLRAYRVPASFIMRHHGAPATTRWREPYLAHDDGVLGLEQARVSCHEGDSGAAD